MKRGTIRPAFVLGSKPERLTHHARRLILRLASAAERIAAYQEGLRLLPLRT